MPPSPPKVKVEQSSFNRIRLVENPDPARELKEVNTLGQTALGSTNVDGVPASELVSVSATAAPAVVAPPREDESGEQAFAPLEKGPEFPGGPGAWAHFLGRYLQVPGELEPGEKKVVLINFMVDADGSVTRFTVVQSAGAAFDNEVIRVLKKMPRWKPALQNGHPVAVPFTQPVTFVGVENSKVLNCSTQLRLC